MTSGPVIGSNLYSKMKLPIFLLVFVCSMLGCKEDDIIPKEVTLDYYEEAYEIPGLEFLPQNKTAYVYDFTGRLKSYTFYSFDPVTETMVEHRRFVFSYVDDVS